MTLANKITIVRILLIPVFVLFAVYYGKSVELGQPETWQRWAAIITFIVAAGTDGVDGWVARRFKQRSPLGAVLDPIADKGLLLAAIITLSLSKWTRKLGNLGVMSLHLTCSAVAGCRWLERGTAALWNS